MPNIDFIVDDGEFAYEGVANYSVRKGCKGDMETPGVADAVEDIILMRIEASGVVAGEKIKWRDLRHPEEQVSCRVKIRNSRLLMERLEELCEADLLKGER